MKVSDLRIDQEVWIILDDLPARRRIKSILPIEERYCIQTDECDTVDIADIFDSNESTLEFLIKDCEAIITTYEKKIETVNRKLDEYCDRLKELENGIE